MATITIAPAEDVSVASSAYILYSDNATGTIKKCPISVLPLTAAEIAALAAKQDTLVSGTNIKTINSTSVLGSGNVAVQATLVSGTNIKTINGSSILGSGNLTVSGGGSSAWGGITGDIEDQTDLQLAFDGKNDISSEQSLTDGATITWDLSDGNIADVTIAGSRTVSLINAPTPSSGYLIVTQGGTGSNDLDLPGNKASGFALSTGVGDVDIIYFTKNSQGIFWGIDNYGTVTSPVTLNAPTSFAAGTPTATGVPFTWTDTNSSPNESSYLIQITTAADTGYASVVATRTPAANATSAAAGTGLTASTAYRARIKSVGNGSSTLDSGYSSEVTFTTAAGSSTLLFDDFTRANSTSSMGNTVTPGSAWPAPYSGTWGIRSNKAYCVSATSSGATNFFAGPPFDLGVSDFTMTVDTVNALSTGGRGIFFRAVDENNLWFIEIDQVNDFHIYKRVAGSFGSPLHDTATAPGGAGVSVECKVVCAGSNIQVFRDGVLEFNFSDATFNTATKVGFLAESGATLGGDFSFGDILVDP